MDVLNDDGTSVGHIIAGISDVVKAESSIGDVADPVSVKVLWNTGDSFEVIHDGVPEVKAVVDGSLGEMGHGGGDQMLTNGHGLTDGASLTQQGAEENTILSNDDISEGHMLHVPESDGTILADTPTTIQVATSLASELAANSDHDVIQLLLPTEENNDNGSNGLQSMNISLGAGSIASPIGNQPSQTVQAITLADGTTAFIQHPNGKFLEGQTITLEDGSTAVVQGIPSKLSTVNLVTTSTVPNISSCKSEAVETQAIQGVHLEDGTATFLNQAVKDGLQAIILEDGTTAYLATQQSQGFMENAQLEATTLTLDQLTSPVGGVQALLPNGIVNMDGKPLSISSQPVVSQGTDQAGGIDSKATLVMSTSGVDKSSPFVEKAYKCSYDSCGRFYTTLHHLRVHERSHTGDRPFRCEFNGCGKAFATGYGLKSHFRVHTGEKPYKCPEGSCDKAFKTSGDLQKHVRTHTGERPFRCPFEGCTRSFTTSNIRKVHIRTHTGERPYTCPEEGCGRAFASATNYKNHIRIHTGEKPYVCTVQGCGKRFTEYSSLYKHHVVHTHAKPYTCNRCGKTYRQTSTLAMHKRTAHGEDVTAESEALLYDQTQNVTVEGLEPPDKRQRFNFSLNQEEIQDEGEGTLIINTSEPGQQHLALVGSDSLTSVTTDGLQSSPLTNHTALLQQAGVATFTLGDQGQQVYVITDPAQLEALQQIAQHQFDSENLTSSLITSLPSGDVTALESTDVTTVTEINPNTDITDNQVSSINPAHETDIQNY